MKSKNVKIALVQVFYPNYTQMEIVTKANAGQVRSLLRGHNDAEMILIVEGGFHGYMAGSVIWNDAGNEFVVHKNDGKKIRNCETGRMVQVDEDDCIRFYGKKVELQNYYTAYQLAQK